MGGSVSAPYRRTAPWLAHAIRSPDSRRIRTPPHLGHLSHVWDSNTPNIQAKIMLVSTDDVEGRGRRGQDDGGRAGA